MRSVIVVSTLLLVSPSAWAQRLPSPDVEEDREAEVELRFKALAQLGDHERAAGRLREAARAYRQALNVRHDSLVAGRLGMVLVEGGRPEDAPELLLDAIHRAPAATPAERAERKRFFEAHEVARAHGSWVEVMVSHAGARVTVDGIDRNDAGRSAFWTFVAGGEHEIRATLDGFEEAVVKFTAVKGKDMKVPVPLTARKVEQGPGVYVPEKDPTATLSAVVSGPGFTKQEDPFAYDDQPKDPTKPDEKKGLRGFIGGGPVVVFGVASWMPAVGATLAGGVQPNDYVSLRLEARAAWLTTGVADRPISAMTAGGIASVCGHYKWIFGCALGHLGVITVDFAVQSFKPANFSAIKPGAGARVGANVRVTQSFALHAEADVLGLSSGVQVAVGSTVVSDQPPVMIGVQFGGGWEF
ncbi:tetratricopeptide repeat protein [Polyangium mundeleinium]|uniref:Tetratricopeptide repeat protein n=1 Tax=Polyangium mundeleinium TaxID=2995306 RepID=A0ABT5EXI4_9BACT|nr:tetratricopeptide repeat protein [Polyangium mundeleinium]MDC0746537.1 tetratricopeptide repeat protein [Polyangium mundeleinium]